MVAAHVNSDVGGRVALNYSGVRKGAVHIYGGGSVLCGAVVGFGG